MYIPSLSVNICGKYLHVLVTGHYFCNLKTWRAMLNPRRDRQLLVEIDEHLFSTAEMLSHQLKKPFNSF